MNRKIVTLLCAALVSLGMPVHPAMAEEDHETIAWGDRGDEVVEAQYILVSFGYGLKADGIYGVRTYKAVTKWQKANGLQVDGIIGPRTWESLLEAFEQTHGGVSPQGAPAGSTQPPAPAPQETPGPTPAPSADGSNGYGLRGLPFAPDGLDACAEMNFYRVQWNLPDQFSDYPRSGPRSQQGYGWRESKCRNDVTSGTGCCVGYLQIHTGNFTAPGYRSGIAACEVSKRSDILGNAPLQKQKQMCVAKVLYDVSGLSPWRL